VPFRPPRTSREVARDLNFNTEECVSVAQDCTAKGGIGKVHPLCGRRYVIPRVGNLTEGKSRECLKFPQVHEYRK
jgi:hypothetical protein